MHILLSINSNEANVLKLPRANLHLFQSMVYRLLPAEWGDFLHNQGYVVDGHPLKLFAIGWPSSKTAPKIGADSIEFALPISIVVSTPVAETLDGVACGALASREIRIGNNLVYCEEIKAAEMSADGEEMTVKTLSPITCYIASQREDGRKYTVYLTPYQKEFSESVHNNLIKKFRALYPGAEIPEGRVEISPLGEVREQVSMYDRGKTFPIKGWSGTFKVTGPNGLLSVALECGLGAKNSSCFGCIVRADVEF
ncbi:CRISPR-associated endoribonuclease Cas6 [Synergistes jonesii]|uniref:CRISPR-associated endoribonuclease Cas6 n=1 Tax=Synergistes jonesii TaxID=2754 RepID=UPI002432A53C|nr:CRISPR-associated endoribonuclease Cas6 [Synergistes jonesii]